MAPQTLVPDTSRLRDENYGNSFIKHLISHLNIINEFGIRLKSSNNYFFDISYINKPEFKDFKQKFIDIFYKKGLLTILCSGMIDESISCCEISPDICPKQYPEIVISWLKLLNAISDTDFVIILGFEDQVMGSVKINSNEKKTIKYEDDWYNILNEIIYFKELKLPLAIKINSKRGSISIDKKYDFHNKFYVSVNGIDEKTTRNIITTLVDALHTVYHRAKKLHTNIYRKDCNNGCRIHYSDFEGKLMFLHYGKHDEGLKLFG